MNGFLALAVIGVLVILVAFIVLQRKKPEEADAIAQKADSWWKKLFNRGNKS